MYATHRAKDQGDYTDQVRLSFNLLSSSKRNLKTHYFAAAF